MRSPSVRNQRASLRHVPKLRKKCQWEPGEHPLARVYRFLTVTLLVVVAINNTTAVNCIVTVITSVATVADSAIIVIFAGIVAIAIVTAVSASAILAAVAFAAGSVT
jgi:hypothetical protein